MFMKRIELSFSSLFTSVAVQELSESCAAPPFSEALSNTFEYA